MHELSLRFRLFVDQKPKNKDPLLAYEEERVIIV